MNLVNFVRAIRDISLAIILSLSALLLIVAVVAPTTFGEWLQTIDTARYALTMYE